MSEAPRITVGTVSYYSAGHLVELMRNLRQTAVDSELAFVVCDNSGGRDLELYEALDGACEIIPFDPPVPMSQLRDWQKEAEPRRESACPPYEHGLGLNRLLASISSEYALFLDPDCRMLTRGWDHVCRRSLTGPFVAIGAPYHSTKIGKYHDFPSPVFTFFETRAFRTMGADWRPFDVPTPAWVFWRNLLWTGGASVARKLGHRVLGWGFYAGLAGAWLRRVSGDLHRDTGWRNPRRAEAQGFASRLLTPAVVPRQLSATAAVEADVVALMREFELFTCAGVPFLTHYHGTVHRKRGDFAQTDRRWRRLSSSVTESQRHCDLRELPPAAWNSDRVYL